MHVPLVLRRKKTPQILPLHRYGHTIINHALYIYGLIRLVWMLHVPHQQNHFLFCIKTPTTKKMKENENNLLKVALNTIKPNSFTNWGSSGRDHMVVGLQLAVQSVPITTIIKF